MDYKTVNTGNETVYHLVIPLSAHGGIIGGVVDLYPSNEAHKLAANKMNEYRANARRMAGLE